MSAQVRPGMVGSAGEYGASALLLRRLGWREIDAALDDERRAIDWVEVQRVQASVMFSTGEEVLVEMALALWTGRADGAAVTRAMQILDDGNWTAVMEALAIRRPVRMFGCLVGGGQGA